MSATCRSDFRLGAQQGFEPGHNVGQLTYSLLQLPLDLFNGTRVEASASHLSKVASPRCAVGMIFRARQVDAGFAALDRKSTRLNSSHLGISYAVFCLKKKKTTATRHISSRERQAHVTRLPASASC